MRLSCAGLCDMRASKADGWTVNELTIASSHFAHKVFQRSRQHRFEFISDDERNAHALHFARHAAKALCTRTGFLTHQDGWQCAVRARILRLGESHSHENLHVTVDARLVRARER